MMLISRTQDKLDDVARSLGECVCVCVVCCVWEEGGSSSHQFIHNQTPFHSRPSLTHCLHLSVTSGSHLPPPLL